MGHADGARRFVHALEDQHQPGSAGQGVVDRLGDVRGRIDGGRINDEAIAVLIAMPLLREVDLKGTAVTEKGAEILRAANPRAVVYIGPWEGKAAAYRNN